MKTYAIGDIHGAHRALVQVLARADFDYDNDRLISLGDVADTWPEVPQCVEELLKIKHLVAVAGNHDTWARDFLNTQIAPEIWLLQGGQATKDAYMASLAYQDPKQIGFFNAQVPYFVDKANRLFVHGGFAPSLPIEDQTLKQVSWNRDLWKKVNYLHQKGEKTYADVNHFKEVFIGHSPTLLVDPSGQPVQRLNVWNLDTGVKSGGKLTLMEVKSKAVYQSDPVSELY